MGSAEQLQLGHFLKVSIGVGAVGAADCSLDIARGAAGGAGAGLTGNNPGEGSGLTRATSVGGQHVRLDSVWVTFMDVVACIYTALPQ